MRLVLDTDVVVAALRSPAGASAELLRMLDEGRIVLLLSVALALEYESVCLLAEHILAAGIKRWEAESFVSSVVGLAEAVEIHYRWRPALRDPGDEMVLETAVNGRADALVTFNRRDFRNVPESFGIDVFLPREALTLVRSRNK